MEKILRMKKTTSVIILLLFLYAGRVAAVDTPVPAVRIFREVVSKLVELKKEIAQEKTRWKEQREQMEADLSLLTRERDTRKGEMIHPEEGGGPPNKEKNELAKRMASDRESLERLRPILDSAEKDLRNWQRRIPSSLLPPMAASFAKVESSGRRSIPERMETVLSLYGAIETLQSGVTLAKEMVPRSDGPELEMDILYLGLVRCYGVSRDDRTSGYAKPNATRDAWKWTWDPRIASSVRRAIEVHRRERVAELIPLPLAAEEKKSSGFSAFSFRFSSCAHGWMLPRPTWTPRFSP